MIDKHNQHEEYMTGWEIVGSIILFALMLATCYLILLIGA